MAGINAPAGYVVGPPVSAVERRNSIEMWPEAVNVPVMLTSGPSSVAPSAEKLSPQHSAALSPGRAVIAPKFGGSFSNQQDRRLAGRAAASGWKHQQPMSLGRQIDTAPAGLAWGRRRALRRLYRGLVQGRSIRLLQVLLKDPKYVAVGLLVAHSVLAPLLIRVSRLQATRKGAGGGYLTSVAVFLGEVMKFICSLSISFYESGMSESKWRSQLTDSIFRRPKETAGVALVALLYSFQNLLIYMALTYINAATFQVTYQMRILLTAVLSLVMLRRRISLSRWLSVALLTVGVALVELPSHWGSTDYVSAAADVVEGAGNNRRRRFLESVARPVQQHTSRGAHFRWLLVMLPCLTSAFSGVFFERLLKKSPVSIWIRNVQLAFYGMAFSLVFILGDRRVIAERGWLQGFDSLVWTTVIVQALGGLIIAAVLKYADNIVKCFGNATGLVLSVLASSLLVGDVPISATYVVGTAIVVVATYAYGVDLPLVGRQAAAAVSRQSSMRPQGSAGRPVQEQNYGHPSQ